MRLSDKYKSLGKCIISNYNTFKEKSLDKRITTTNINKSIHETLYAVIDIIVNEHLESLEQIDYWVLNVSVCTAPYTIKQYVGQLKTTAAAQKERNAKVDKKY